MTDRNSLHRIMAAERIPRLHDESLIHRIAQRLCARATGRWPCDNCLRDVASVIRDIERDGYRVAHTIIGGPARPETDGSEVVKVYVAGPYTHGDVARNVRTAIDAANALAERKFCPYVPHLTHFWHLVSPKPYDWWLQYDAMWLLDCQAVLRLPGDSAGADQEVKLAEAAGIPVVTTIDALDEVRDARHRAQQDRLAAMARPAGDDA
jgi:hypothetical protein